MSQEFLDAARARDAHQHRPCITGSDGRVLTYGALAHGAARYAHALRALGVSPGDRVAARLEKSPEAVLLYLACLRTGAIFLPLNTAYVAAELEHLLGDAEPRLVICDPGRKQQLARPGVTLRTLGADGHGTFADLAGGMPTSFTDAPCAQDDVAAILYTSGTTGRPKGAMLTHRNLSSNARTLVEAWRFTPDDVLLHALPIFHAHGLFIGVNVALLARASMLFLPGFDREEVLRLLPQASVMMGVPTFYKRLLESPLLTRERVAHVRCFICGSAPLQEVTFRQWRERTGQTILERYGMTETIITTSNPYDGVRKVKTVGLPLRGVSLRIVDPDTHSIRPTGEVGMIEVKGESVFKGYWRNPEKTKEEFSDDGYFATGDLGLVDDDGYVHVVGRNKDLIITGGLNVYPKEVEHELDGLPGVAESAVVGLPHPDFGEGVTAFVVLRGGAQIDTASTLRALSDRLANYKQPKAIVVLPELPRNGLGKVQKNILRDCYGSLYERR